MDEVEKTFDRLQKNGRKAVIPYLTFGYPDVKRSLDYLTEAQEGGADLIEIGFPFSDPLADGPVLQENARIALANGATLPRLLKELGPLRSRLSVPLMLMTYLNPLLSYGIRRLGRSAREAGIAGLIVPDVPVEEVGYLKEARLPVVLLLAPTSTIDRTRKILRMSEGFVYIVSVTGVTGARKRLPDPAPWLRRIRLLSGKPLCVGFGIGTGEAAGKMARGADGVIVGSALARAIRIGYFRRGIVKRFVSQIRKGVDDVSRCHGR